VLSHPDKSLPLPGHGSFNSEILGEATAKEKKCLGSSAKLQALFP
jgi:hypothetical protein